MLNIDAYWCLTVITIVVSYDCSWWMSQLLTTLLEMILLYEKLLEFILINFWFRYITTNLAQTLHKSHVYHNMTWNVNAYEWHCGPTWVCRVETCFSTFLLLSSSSSSISRRLFCSSSSCLRRVERESFWRVSSWSSSYSSVKEILQLEKGIPVLSFWKQSI